MRQGLEVGQSFFARYLCTQVDLRGEEMDRGGALSSLATSRSIPTCRLLAVCLHGTDRPSLQQGASEELADLLSAV